MMAAKPSNRCKRGCTMKAKKTTKTKASADKAPKRTKGGADPATTAGAGATKPEGEKFVKAQKGPEPADGSNSESTTETPGETHAEEHTVAAPAPTQTAKAD